MSYIVGYPLHGPSMRTLEEWHYDAYHAHSTKGEVMKVYQRTKEPAKDRAVHPLVRWMWREMNRQRASQEDVAVRSGIASSTMRKWRQGVNSPKLADIEAVINTLGGKIIVKVDDDIGTSDQKGS